MSKPLKQTELNRLAWLTALRSQGHRQCHGTWTAEGGKVCAMELVREMVSKPAIYHTVTRLGELVELTEHQVQRVMQMNDGTYIKDGEIVLGEKQTFAEIADKVASWFQPEKP